MMKSSIEYLAEIIRFANKELYAEIFEEIQQAKEMHKEEIIDAWDNAAIDATYGNKFSSSKQYYNETFNK